MGLFGLPWRAIFRWELQITKCIFQPWSQWNEISFEYQRIILRRGANAYGQAESVDVDPFMISLTKKYQFFYEFSKNVRVTTIFDYIILNLQSGSVVFLYSPDKHGRYCVPIEATSAYALSIWIFPTFSHLSHGAGWYSSSWDKAYLIIDYYDHHLSRVEGNIQSEGIYDPIHPYSRQWCMIIILWICP